MARIYPYVIVKEECRGEKKQHSLIYFVYRERKPASLCQWEVHRNGACAVTMRKVIKTGKSAT